MRHLNKEHPKENIPLCEYFEEDLSSFKTAEDIISESEQVVIEARLMALDHYDEAEFFKLIYFTGMRFNEALGLSLKDIYACEIPDPHFKRKLRKQGVYFFKDEGKPTKSHEIEFEYYGYIVLGSQPSGDGQKAINRDTETGKIPRKPLKSQKEMYGKHLATRLIPIIDKKLMAALLERARTAKNMQNKGLTRRFN